MSVAPASPAAGWDRLWSRSRALDEPPHEITAAHHWALAAVMAAGAALLLWEMREHTLAFDEWSFFADFRGLAPDVVASPFGENLLLAPVLIYKAVFALFGPDTVVLKLIAVGLNLTCAALLFTLIAPRIGGWVALPATATVILLGAASDIAGQTLGIAIMLTVACGLGALVALERDGPRSDPLAAVLLGVALASNTSAIPFAVAAAAHIFWVDPRSARSRAWIVAAPAALYLVWRVWSLGVEPVGTLATHPVDTSLGQVGTMFTSIADSLAAALLVVTGLFPDPGVAGSYTGVLGPAVVVAFAVAVALRLRAGPPLRRELIPFVALPLAYWAMIGAVGNDRLPATPRFQYLGAIAALLLIAALLRGVRLPDGARAALAGVFALGLAANIATLDVRSDFVRDRSRLDRAALAAIEIARDRVDPDLLVEPLGARFDPTAPGLYTGPGIDIVSDVLIRSGRYLDAADDFGSPAYTQAELAGAGPSARAYADRELAVALGIGHAPASAAALGGVACERGRSEPGARQGLEAPVGPRGLVVRALGADAIVRLGRFGDGHAVEAVTVTAGTSVKVRIPSDRSDRPWRAIVETAGAMEACPLGR